MKVYHTGAHFTTDSFQIPVPSDEGSQIADAAFIRHSAVTRRSRHNHNPVFFYHTEMVNSRVDCTAPKRVRLSNGRKKQPQTGEKSPVRDCFFILLDSLRYAKCGFGCPAGISPVWPSSPESFLQSARWFLRMLHPAFRWGPPDPSPPARRRAAGDTGHCSPW